jgi:hypothetical protein
MMNTETTVAPVAETQTPATEVVAETPEVTTPEAAEATEQVEVTSQDQTEDEASKALKRMQRRIDKRTADVYRERAQNEQLARRVAELEAQSGTETRPQQQETSVEARAREIARVERYKEQAEQIVSTGQKAYPDYIVALRELAREVGDFVKPNGAPSEFMDVVLEVVDKPAEVLYYLGKNPDVAEELADLSPLKLAKKLDRIERELADRSVPKPGSAPKPPEAVKPRATESGLHSDLSVEEWMKRRERQLKESRGY